MGHNLFVKGRYFSMQQQKQKEKNDSIKTN